MFGQSIQGNARTVDFLSRGLKTKELHHAYCFVGPDHSGKRMLALELARALMCLEGTLCGACSSCTQVNHADLLQLDGEIEQLAVETVRDWLQSLTLTSFGKGRRVGVLYHAHAMPEKTQNTLLKTLEEPPANTVIILTSNAPLIPTIMSRVQMLLVNPRVVGVEGEDDTRRAWQFVEQGMTNDLMTDMTADEPAITRQRIIAMLEKLLKIARAELLGIPGARRKIFSSRYATIQALDAIRVSLRALHVNADPRMVLENVYYQMFAKKV